VVCLSAQALRGRTHAFKRDAHCAASTRGACIVLNVVSHTHQDAFVGDYCGETSRALITVTVSADKAGVVSSPFQATYGTPPHHAANKGRNATAAALIKGGADINAKSKVSADFSKTHALTLVF